MVNSIRSNSEEYDITDPHAGAMIESLRAFGYDLQTAIADLIDNSITARACNVWLDFYWNGEGSHISVRDDGKGMSERELGSAMRLGSQNPAQPREAKDLGRFGLGLKTASFSQCRIVSVLSRTNKGEESFRCWDLDYVGVTGQWRLLKKPKATSKKALSALKAMASGTIVLWESLDRVVGGTRVDSESHHRWFLDQVEAVRRHLAMVFHRFIQRPKVLKIWINGRPVEAWDPFLTNEPASQSLGEEVLKIAGGNIIVRPYVLPHISKITPETHSKAAGPRGWNAHQGFYIYRNERLLVAGDWLNLGFQKEEHNKLARILVDIPNSMDSLWEIDVKKSRARPPSLIRGDFKRIARLTRERACAIYRHRGKVIARENAASYIFVWDKRVLHGNTFYTINRNHPLIQEIIKGTKEQSTKIKALLGLLEKTVPVPLIVLNNAENPDAQGDPFEGSPSRELVEIMSQLYRAMVASGFTKEDARKRLSIIEPFDKYPELLATIESISA